MLETLLGLGYIGLFIACFISGTFIPFSSDILLIALVVAGGDVYTCLIVATLANGSGGMVNYIVGRMGKITWIEKYSKISREKIDNMQKKLKDKGGYVALFSWIPVAGDIMMISLGYLRVNPVLTTICLFIGKGLRYIVILFVTMQGINLFQ
ncbi:MAG: DedA family protein [Candidatus Azobacteroides sp.]|nr:DedA family protein [Candidatus Azobacteroides sp.]